MTQIKCVDRVLPGASAISAAVTALAADLTCLPEDTAG